MADDTIPARSDLEARWKRDLSARVPGVDVSDNSPAFVDAKLVAGILSPVYAKVVTVQNGTSLQGKTHQQLADELKARGDDFLPAAGSSGFVIVRAATGGGNILKGDVITINGQDYACETTGLYLDQKPVPVVAVATGPLTDQPAGAIGKWAVQPLGIGPQATVQARQDGTGLIGGANMESDAEVVQRLEYQNANPAASGNSAEYIDRAEKTPALAIEQGYNYPGILGSGTSCVTATMRRSAPGISRIPSSVELAQIAVWVPGKMPGDDSSTLATLISNPVTLAIAIGWAKGANWQDPIPWPAWTTVMVCVKATPTPTATTFTLTNITLAPVPGLTIAFYDRANQVFRAKRILTATLVGSDYAIVCDTTNSASDLTYTPIVAQPCGPWSDALDALSPPLVGSMDSLGPGEQKASFWDPGLRQKRDPAPPLSPYVLTTRLIDPLDDVGLVYDQALLGIYDGSGWNAAPYTTPVGNPGVASYLSELQYLVAFPDA